MEQHENDFSLASGLRSNKTNTVGLIVPRISMFFHAEIITTIQNELHAHGYNLIICQSNDSVEVEKELSGGYLAAAHLLELGCRRIAYISGPLNCSIYIDRFAGFQNAMQQ